MLLDAFWGENCKMSLESLETLLRFFHVECKPFLDALQPQSRSTILANIDVTASETFFNAKSNKKIGVPKIQETLLEATAKFVQQLDVPEQARKSSDHPWIDFSARADAEEKDEKSRSPPRLPSSNSTKKQVLRSTSKWSFQNKKRKRACLTKCLGANGVRQHGLPKALWKQTKHPQSRLYITYTKASV